MSFKKENGEKKNLVCIGITNQKVTFPPEEAVNVCREWCLPLSGLAIDREDNNRYYLLFIINTDDEREKKLAFDLLSMFFPKKAVIMNRVPERFKLNNAEVIYSSREIVEDVFELLIHLKAFLHEKYPTNHSSKFKKICLDNNLKMEKNFPVINFTKKIPPGNIYRVKDEVKFLIKEHKTYNKYIRKFAHLLVFNDDENKTIPLNDYQGEIQKLDFSEIEENCQLFKDVSDGKKIQFYEALGLLTNLMYVEGGQTEGEKIVEKCTKKPKVYARLIKQSKHPPKPCDSFCPYAKECRHAENILKTVIVKRGEYAIIEPQTFKELEAMERELSRVASEVLKEEEPFIDVVICPTGVGKTEVVLDYLINNKDCLVAFSTHNLKDQVKQRAEDKDIKVDATPRLPKLDPYKKAQIESYYAVGAHSMAAMCLQYFSKEDARLKKYFQELEKARKSNNPVFTTHERALYMAHTSKKKQVIIDEDITNTLLQIGEVRLQDLEHLLKLETGDEEFIRGIVDYAKGSIVNCVYQNFTYKYLKDKKALWESNLKDLVSSGKKVSNILGFLACNYFIKIKEKNEGTKREEYIIKFIGKRNLPKDKHILIFSATAEPFIYKALFGDRVRIHDLGYVENKGKVLIDISRSNSRSCFRNDLDYLREVVEMVDNDPVITFKKFKGYFKNPVGHFGAIQGLDHLGGKNLWVIGTPHLNPTSYLLYAAILGLDVGLGDQNYDREGPGTFSYRIIERRGIRFKFPVWSADPDLQKIQIFLIESELVQAIGRARPARFDCTVRVLSNFPVVGAEVTNFRETYEDNNRLTVEVKYEKVAS